MIVQTWSMIYLFFSIAVSHQNWRRNPLQGYPRTGSHCWPHLLQSSLDVDPLAPGYSWVNQAVPSIPPAEYINSLPPQALESLSHYLRPIVGKRRGVLVGGMETGVRERWQAGRSCVWECAPGDQNSGRGPGTGSGCRGAAVNWAVLAPYVGLLFHLVG